AVRRVGDERDERQHEAGSDDHAGDDPRQRLLEATTEEPVNHRAGQRQQRRQGGQLDEVDRRVTHARTSASSSTSVLTRLRKMAMRMPRPTATSAAAIASTMKAAPWPCSAWPPPVTDQ